MLYQIVRLSFTNNPPQSRRVVSAFFSPPLAEHRRVAFVALPQKNDFFRQRSFGVSVKLQADYQHFCSETIKKQIFFGVHDKNDYIRQHPKGLNNRIYRKY